MTEKEKISLFRRIDFGDIDANADPNLESYFIDDNYWENIIEKPVFYVIGKKGTGKSALYRMFKKYSYDKGAIISNHDFGDFPINKFMTLSDDDFANPNQYQSLWKLVVLNIFVSLIVNSETADISNNYYEELKKYYDIRLGDASDLLRRSINLVHKREHSLEVEKIGIKPKLSSETGIATEYGFDDYSLSELNRKLLDSITNYFKTCNCNDIPYIIQFDRLDDTYNQANDLKKYYDVIISLMKIVYTMDTNFRINEINNVKVIVYLRTDIVDEIAKRDSESARWDDFTYKLNWAIVNKKDWKDSKLLKVIDKRISTSINDEINLRSLLDSSTIQLQRKNYSKEKYKDVIKYIVDQTMHRPRDLIMFCKYIKKEIEKPHCQEISYRTIKNAEKEFCDWLANKELANEINPIIKNTKELYDILRRIGDSPFKYEQFKTLYDDNDTLNKYATADEMAEYLYDIGIFMNVYWSYVPNKKRNVQRFKSKIRNYSSIDKNMKLQIHPGVWKGINS